MSVLEKYPHIDPDVKYVGVSKLREFNLENLRQTTDTFVIQDDSKPIRVLLTYEKFLAMQDELMAVSRTVEMLADPREQELLKRAAEDMRAGRTRSLDEIDADVKRRG